MASNAGTSKKSLKNMVNTIIKSRKTESSKSKEKSSDFAKGDTSPGLALNATLTHLSSSGPQPSQLPKYSNATKQTLNTQLEEEMKNNLSVTNPHSYTSDI